MKKFLETVQLFMDVGVVNKSRFTYVVELVWLGVALSFKYVCKVWPRELL